MILTPTQIERFSIINEKIRAEEVKARAYLLQLRAVLDLQVKEGMLDDYETEPHFSIFSFCEDYCQRKGVEVGGSFYETGIYTLSPDDDEFFNRDWYVSGMAGIEQLRNFHFGYLMHCLIDHTDLQLADILAIDDVWIEIIVQHQFWTHKISDVPQ